jgi:predicted MPP superfamily phosphohydrolase
MDILNFVNKHLLFMLSLEDKFNILKWTLILFTTSFVIVIFLIKHRLKGGNLILTFAVIGAFLGVLALADIYWIEPNWIATQEVIVHDPALAKVLAGVKVVQISDIHMRGGGGYLEKKLVEKVNSLKPDLLFITGDFFSENYKKELKAETDSLDELLRGFRAPAGVFGVRGNYDGPLRNPAVNEVFNAAGIDILLNEMRLVSLPNRRCLYLLGASAIYSGSLDESLVKGMAGHSPTILLAHDPEVFGGAMVAGVNLVLVGHTHGGQIGVPFLVRKSNSANKSSFMSGLYDAGRTKMYVNRGIGTTHLPVRFLCRPEITVFRFEK